MFWTLFLLSQTDGLGPPDPFGPKPSLSQMKLYSTGLTARINFGSLTFCPSNCSANLFSPTALDTDQWVLPFRQAGFSRVILTARDQFGFCLWKSKNSRNSVAASETFQKTSETLGQSGDVVVEFTKSCAKYEVSAGLAFSMLDGLLPLIREVIGTEKYGSIDEVVVDSNEEAEHSGRKMLKLRKGVHEINEEILFTGACEDDARPVKKVKDPYWARIKRPKRGATQAECSDDGDENGELWSVGEVDVNLGTSRYWNEKDSVVSLESLVDAFFASVGHSQVMVLNVAPSKEGILEQVYVDRIREFGEGYKKTFEVNLAEKGTASACSVRGNAESYKPENVLTCDGVSYWTMNDDEMTGWIVIDLQEPTEFDIVEIREYVALGQRIKRFVCQVHVDGHWVIFQSGSTIGARRLLRRSPVMADKVRVLITESLATPVVQFIGIYKADPRFELQNKFPDGLVAIPMNLVSTGTAWSPVEKGIEAVAEHGMMSFAFQGTMVWIIAEVSQTAKFSVQVNGQSMEPADPLQRSSTGIVIFRSQALDPSFHIVEVACEVLPVTIKGIYKLDNNGVGMIQFENDVYSVAAGQSLLVTIVRIGGEDSEISFKLETVRESAEPEKDFLPESKDIVMKSGEATKTITIKTLSNNDRRGEVSFYLELSAPSRGALLGFKPIAQVRLAMRNEYGAGFAIPIIGGMDRSVVLVILIFICLCITVVLLAMLHRQSRVIRDEASLFIRPGMPNNLDTMTV